MLVRWDLFNLMFPTYYSLRTPMWSEEKETDDELTLKVVVPGYEKEDFELYVEDGALFLDLKKTEGKSVYSILGSYYNKEYEFEKAKATYKSGILKITVPKSTRKSERLALKVS